MLHFAFKLTLIFFKVAIFVQLYIVALRIGRFKQMMAEIIGKIANCAGVQKNVIINGLGYVG